MEWRLHEGGFSCLHLLETVSLETNRHAQRLLSWMILGPVKLAIPITQQKVLYTQYIKRRDVARVIELERDT